MLFQRVLTALVLAPLAIAIILLPPTWLFALIVAAVFLVAQWEWMRLCGVRTPIMRIAVLVLTAVLFAVLWWQRARPSLWLVVVGLGALWWVFSLLWFRAFSFAAAPTRENAALKVGVGLLVFVPAWTALASVHGLHAEIYVLGLPQGRWWTLVALVIVWAADIGAYTTGRTLGKRKLAPSISPGKTRAGAYGALVAGTLVAVIAGALLGVRGGLLVGLAVVALFTVAASIIGDLLESLMKRHAEVKDSGTLFPGHGGLLDRLDSVFAALPVFALGLGLLAL